MMPIPILLYHRFNQSGDSLSTPPEVFEKELSWLVTQGYRSLTLEEFEHRLSHPGKAKGKKGVLITFDDGYVELATVAAPALRRHGLTGVAFLITSECSPAEAPGNLVRPSGNHISWEQARALASEGVIEFQSHTHSHKRWDTGPEGGEEVRRDLATSLDILTEQLRLPRLNFRHLAWPWGLCNEDWERIGRNLGFSYQHIVQRGAVTRTGHTMHLPRICFDGASARTFNTWMTLLSFPGGANLSNRVFGTIRAHRQGLGYV